MLLLSILPLKVEDFLHHADIEGVYELGTPLEYRACLRLGCVARVSQGRIAALKGVRSGLGQSATFELDDLELVTTVRARSFYRCFYYCFCHVGGRERRKSVITGDFGDKKHFLPRVLYSGSQILRSADWKSTAIMLKRCTMKEKRGGKTCLWFVFHPIRR